MSRLIHQAGLVTGLSVFVPTVLFAAVVLLLLDHIGRISGSFGLGINRALSYTQDLFADQEELMLKYGDD